MINSAPSLVQHLRTAVFIAMTASAVACKTTGNQGIEGANLKDSSSIQSMRRYGDVFEITCLDGTLQTVAIAEFASKDPRDICPGVGYSECGQRVTYSNGRDLRSSNGTYYYPNGSVAITPSGRIRYLNGQNLSDSRNNLFFGNGSPLVGLNGTLMYPEGNFLRSASGAIYYPDNSPLALASGALRYPGNKQLSDDSGNFFYSDDSNRRLKSGDSVYYKNGTIARSGQSLFRFEDRKQTRSPIMIEEAIGDGAVTRGLIRFNIAPTQINYQIDLPKLHPDVAAKYDSKRNSWIFTYHLTNADFPIFLTIDNKTITKTMYLKTGYTNSTVIVDLNKSPYSCRIVNTAIQSGGSSR